jgi:hypothetical protein
MKLLASSPSSTLLTLKILLLRKILNGSLTKRFTGADLMNGLKIFKPENEKSMTESSSKNDRLKKLKMLLPNTGFTRNSIVTPKKSSNSFISKMRSWLREFAMTFLTLLKIYGVAKIERWLIGAVF